MSYVYVAHPIDQVGRGGHVLTSLRLDVKDAMRQSALLSYWPADAWSVPELAEGDGLRPQERQAIDQMNKAALGGASQLLALVPDSVPSLGVPAEIEQSLADGKVVSVIAGAGAMRSVQMHQWAERGAHVTTSIPDALTHLVKSPRVEKRTPEGKKRVLFTQDGLQTEAPAQAHPGDAGFDLVCSENVIIEPGEFVNVGVDLRFEMPPEMWGWIVGRSSTLRNRGLLVNQGIIDNGYRGPMYVGVWNLNKEDSVLVVQGERLAQLIPMPLLADSLEWTRIRVLSETSRGENGFGSSGQ